MSLINSKLSKTSQTQKSTYCLVPILWNGSKDKSNLLQQKAGQWCLGPGVVSGRVSGKDTGKLWGEGNVYILIVMVVA